MDKISESVQKIIAEYIRELGKQIPIQKAILFGSYAKGTIHRYSDVDIAIFSDYFKDMSRVDGIHFLLLSAMDYDMDIEPQPFTMDEYREPVGLVEEILKTGIELELPQAS
ncbi:nucleotidyltransferase domain-containing protein [Clostridium sp. P21]|uniref:Nucleotidyltransferase domain-containing protein n=1 Tax=Clostridium muellerianum TaxID=2716538 RepID=A0A7Y0HQU0_9CLOT|nr:nucleotidyltransferase domain-containing protein [Clostridium muellerianum]NMM65117.1 nucleotidyltransferase domain-containing protein [Clostridium muellerianum]